MPATLTDDSQTMTKAASRDQLLQEFLAAQADAPFERQPIPGDASFRRYERLKGASGKYWILMDAPPPEEDVQPFIIVARYLKDRGLSAPAIQSADITHGFLLLEDLGQGLFRHLLDHLPSKEQGYYRQAVDVLLSLRYAENTLDLLPYDRAIYRRELSLFGDWFAPHAGAEWDDKEKELFLNLWDAPLAQAMQAPHTIVLRDYHAENLLWLPERDGNARVGLLDFQDALWGSAAYDLVSLLEDARRDVSRDVAEDLLSYFVTERFGQDDIAARQFRDSYAILGAQRNLKIIGIFARLHRRDGKARYLNYLPRVWGHLRRDLEHPALAEIQRFLLARYPAEMAGAEASAA